MSLLALTLSGVTALLSTLSSVKDDEPHALLVKVVDQVGRRVSGASLRVRRIQSQTDEFGQASLKLPGNWVLRLKEQGVESEMIFVHHPDFARTAHPIDLSQPLPGSLTIHLHRGVSVKGQVVWKDGTPLKEVSVSIYNGEIDVLDCVIPHSEAIRNRPFAFYGATKTNEDGKFSFQHLPKPPYHFTVPYARDLEKVVDNVNPGSDGVLIRVPYDDPAALTRPGDAAPLRIQVFDGNDARIEHARVRVLHSGKELKIEAHPHGLFETRPVPCQRYRILVEAEGYRSHCEHVWVTPRKPVEKSIRLIPSRTVTGKIKYPEGLRPKSVWLRDPMSANDRRGSVQPDGTFRVTQLRPGVRYRLVTEVEGQGEKWVGVDPPVIELPPHNDPQPVEVKIAPAAMLRIFLVCDRLPRIATEPVFEDHVEFVAQTFVTIRDHEGAIFAEKYGWGRMQGHFYLPLGSYTAHINVPGRLSRGKRVSLTEASPTETYIGYFIE